MHSPARSRLNAAFDNALAATTAWDIHPSVVVELAALDGALVVDGGGALRAFGAILQPKRRGKVDEEEGSRTKAAVGASFYGLAVKISSDGDITAYADGREFFKV